MNKNILEKRKSQFFTLMLTLLSLISLGIFTQSCSNEKLFEDKSLDTDVSNVRVTDFRNWLNTQQTNNGLFEKNKLNWDNAEIKLMPDGKSRKVSFVVYQGKNLLGNDSIRELHIAYVRNRFIGNVRVLSFSGKEYANAEYYNLTGRILQKGIYYAPKRELITLMRYASEGGIKRLKSASEGDCEGTFEYPDSATPVQLDNRGNPINSAANDAAYNCHSFVWGPLSTSDPYYIPNLPNWNNRPNISGSGYTETSTPQVGDRWVSYGDDPFLGENVPIHSAIILEVTDGKVTKVEAKNGQSGIYDYNPDCDNFAAYKTGTIKYYHE